VSSSSPYRFDQWFSQLHLTTCICTRLKLLILKGICRCDFMRIWQMILLGKAAASWANAVTRTRKRDSLVTRKLNSLPVLSIADGAVLKFLKLFSEFLSNNQLLHKKRRLVFYTRLISYSWVLQERLPPQNPVTLRGAKLVYTLPALRSTE
jgi:hypothetical protein